MSPRAFIIERQNQTGRTWQVRWKCDGKWDVLHRVQSISEILWPEEYGGEPTHVIGETCCGIKGRLSMPGLLSRLAMPRCPECCRIAGVMEGNGMPGNYGIDESVDTWALTLNEWTGV